MPSLGALLSSEVEVSAVVTNPDRPAGRGLEPRPSPVKEVAVAAGLEVLQPDRAREPGLRQRLVELAPDVAVVVAYGSILPKALLEVPRLGFVNLHFSALPAYRGAAPVQRAIIEGAEHTGISVMVLTEGMDEGPVLAIEPVPIGEDTTASELGMVMAQRGAELLVESLVGYASGILTAHPQDARAATYAPKITPDEARIDWCRPARTIRRLVNGLNPAPGAWTTVAGTRLKVYAVRPPTGPVAVAGGSDEPEPGRILWDGGPDLVVETSDDRLALAEVQLAGRRRMSGGELARGLHPGGGQRLI